ncbi:hypothetical protein FNV43_RR11103 [Rhamnella rubrinervis]|uniref:Uncharacterized protein n=1 Tax=Rhamnella rubrinervis TaxID=2594499 RepID=A0A8K0MHB6_9ROSA|nr:hypothetical protein FNV43_RR11103 [Rhamnella rubrinervis]
MVQPTPHKYTLPSPSMAQLNIKAPPPERFADEDLFSEMSEPSFDDPLYQDFSQDPYQLYDNIQKVNEVQNDTDNDNFNLSPTQNHPSRCSSCLPVWQQAMMAHVQAQGYGEPLVVATEVEEEDTEVDSKKDSIGSDSYVPFGYSPELVDPEDFGPLDDPASY